MASRTEGIALLSMYNDEEEEDEEEEEEEEKDVEAENIGGGEVDGFEGVEELKIADYGTASGVDSMSEKNFFGEEDSERKTLPSPALPSSTPPAMDYQEPLPQVAVSEEIAIRRSSKLALTIVDYAHDETAMSPENENGQIESGGRVFFGSEIHASIDHMQEKSLSSSYMVTATSTRISPSVPVEQPSEMISEANELTNTLQKDRESELLVEMDVQQEDDLFSNFLPPPIGEKCSEELQEKINKFLAYKRIGKSFNADLRNRKDYRNPDFLQHAVSYQDIDQHGTCFDKEIFDPHGFDKSDYYDAIEADMKREIERREQERKRSPKVEFLPGGIQPPITIPTQKINAPLPVASSEAPPREGRQSKKSKWDKVETDLRLPSSTGLDAILSTAAGGGGGYTAFAQQKRREAMEKSSERKLDRRS